MVDLKCCGSCCSIFSLVAIIFLVAVSFSIKDHSPSFHLSDDTKRGSIASACGYAALIYGVFFLMSIGCSVYANRNEAKEEASVMVLKPISVEDELLADAERV